jgi:uncharacterized protein
MRIIALEEHYMSPGYLGGPGRGFKENAIRTGGRSAEILEQLSELGAKRIALMDEAGIDVQVLSLHAPGTEQLQGSEAIAVSREANDFIADAARRYPGRFIALATLPTAAPRQAAEELEIRVREQGFKGAVINGNILGRYIDHADFAPILECAERLQVPIYLHPSHPPKPIVDLYYGGFSPQVTNQLSGPGWGWHIDTAAHVIRLIMSGAFDKYPRLQIIIGHMGEGLPFMLQRINGVMSPQVTGLKRSAGDCLRENVHYTFGGFNYVSSFLSLFLEVGAQRIMFSADYPYGSMGRGRAFLEQLPLSPADREAIAHGNAERLLGLQSQVNQSRTPQK